MVLQRNAVINLWGWANAGEKVAVIWMGKTYRTSSGADGNWSVKLPPTQAGGPYSLAISGTNHILLKDIMIGDVWFCSGQSNMALPMERVKERYPEEIASADNPNIRNFFVPTLSDVRKTHSDLPPGQWLKTNPKNVLAFGAATYFFAKQLYQKYHVPIGIINSSVGGTPIQAWLSAEGIRDISPYANRVEQFKDTVYLNGLIHPAKQNRNVEYFTRTDKGLTGPVKWYETSYVPQNWHNFWLPGYWADQGVKGLNGIVWFRKEIVVPASMVGKPAKLFLGRIVDADETYMNGQKVGYITYQYPPRRYDIPGDLLQPGKNIIVVRVTNSSGKGGFVPDKRYQLTDGTTTLDLRGDWTYQVGLAFPPPNPRSAGASTFSAQNEPTGLYNTMVAPAVHYTIKGFIWYQGETNVSKPKEYNELLPALISDWRHKWRSDNLPFLYVQLPNFGDSQYWPTESYTAELREAQLRALRIPNTGMVVTIDAGEWNDIHPLNKKTVGERLALAAEKVAYGNKNIVSSGPLFSTAKKEGSKIVVSFTETGSGLVAVGGGELSQFAIAGADKKFVFATAKIEGDKVIVSSPEVTDPMYVRYAWSDNPEGANLFNKEGLPASPFRTDVP
ncbi:MAG: sialate O-acetylesterase [Mucilaginibacter sp.]